MNLLKSVLAAEVYPALGCTEPIACAFAIATAAEHLGRPVEWISLQVDPGTFKNGDSVVVPNSNGARGNRIAAALGAQVARSAERLELLKNVTPEMTSRAQSLIDSGALEYGVLEKQHGFRIEATVRAGQTHARCVLSEGHTHIERIEKDGQMVFQSPPVTSNGSGLGYRRQLHELDLAALVKLAGGIDDQDRAELRRGIEMNLALSQCGSELRGSAYQLTVMVRNGLLAEDLFHRTKRAVAAAVDARMNGQPLPAMTSGGSGNQGIIASLTPYLVGKERKVEDERILRSIALAHLINAYVKCFTGELAVICGCAMSAGIAAAAAIVYQRMPEDVHRMGLAVNTVVGDLGGMICDGAKPGCAMKAVTSVDAALRSGFMALEGFGLGSQDGVVGRTAEDTIHNLGRITLEGMLAVDPTVLDILRHKAAPGRS
jgi:L-cysteine desulfidase